MLNALCRARRCRFASEILASMHDLAIIGRDGHGSVRATTNGFSACAPCRAGFLGRGVGGLSHPIKRGVLVGYARY
jgi:hypothetical protein